MFERQDCYTLREQSKLFDASVGVIGVGGTGGFVAEALARSGVGQIKIVDGDVFEHSNLNRQIGATRDTLGLAKAEVIANRVRSINPHAQVTALPYYLCAENMEEVFQGVDVVSECVDGKENKLAIAALIEQAGLPYVTGGAGGYAAGTAFVTDYAYGRSLFTPPEDPTFLSPNVTTLMALAAIYAQKLIDFITGRDPQPNNSMRIVLDFPKINMRKPA